MVRKDDKLPQISVRDESNRGLLDEINIAEDSVDVMYHGEDDVYKYVAWPRTITDAKQLIHRIATRVKARRTEVMQEKAEARQERQKRRHV